MPTIYSFVTSSQIFVYEIFDQNEKGKLLFVENISYFDLKSKNVYPISSIDYLILDDSFFPFLFGLPFLNKRKKRNSFIYTNFYQSYSLPDFIKWYSIKSNYKSQNLILFWNEYKLKNLFSFLNSNQIEVKRIIPLPLLIFHYLHKNNYSGLYKEINNNLLFYIDNNENNYFYSSLSDEQLKFFPLDKTYQLLRNLFYLEENAKIKRFQFESLSTTSEKQNQEYISLFTYYKKNESTLGKSIVFLSHKIYKRFSSLPSLINFKLIVFLIFIILNYFLFQFNQNLLHKSSKTLNTLQLTLQSKPDFSTNELSIQYIPELYSENNEALKILYDIPGILPENIKLIRLIYDNKRSYFEQKPLERIQIQGHTVKNPIKWKYSIQTLEEKLRTYYPTKRIILKTSTYSKNLNKALFLFEIHLKEPDAVTKFK